MHKNLELPETAIQYDLKWLAALLVTVRQRTLLTPIVPGGALAISDPSPSHSVLGCSGHSTQVGPLLFQLCFSVSPPTVARPASLSLPLRVPGQDLACGAGCWLPAPLPPQYPLGHWFLSRSLPQIFMPLDFCRCPSDRC